MKRELRDAIAEKIEENLIWEGIYEENLDVIRKKYSQCISNASTIDQANQLAFIFYNDIEDKNHSFEKLSRLYNMGFNNDLIRLFNGPYLLDDKEFELFIKMIKNDIPYFIILAIRSSYSFELLSSFILRNIGVKDILAGNKYGIYFRDGRMKIKSGYEDVIQQKVLEEPECRNELSKFAEIRKWQKYEDMIKTKSEFCNLLDDGDEHNMIGWNLADKLNLDNEEEKKKLDYAYNFDLALYNKGNQIKYMKSWNLNGIKLLLQSKHYGKIEKISDLMKDLSQGKISKKEFDCLYNLVMKDIRIYIPKLLLMYSNNDIDLIEKYYFGYIDVFDEDNSYSHVVEDDIDDEIEEAEEYCKTNGFDDNRRKKYILDKILQKIEVFKKSQAEMKKEHTKEASNILDSKPTKTVENRSTTTDSAKPIDNNRAAILNNLIKNNVDRSVLLASGFSEEEINRFMKPINELLLNLIKNGVSDEILTSSGYSIYEINECKRHL